MPGARVFRSGRGQAVQLPPEFRLTGPEVEIFRRGDELVIRERYRGLERAFELIASLPEFGDIDDPPPQKREGL